MITVIKRDGREIEYNRQKIEKSIINASISINKKIDNKELEKIVDIIERNINSYDFCEINIEEIQNLVEKALKESNHSNIAVAYSNYRRERTKIRDIKSDLMKAIRKIGIQTDRDNANVGNNFSSKLLRIASESNKWHNLADMPKHLAKAHELGELYYHDLDSYNLTTNCLHIPTSELLTNGFNTGYGTINPPRRIETAAELSCILLQSTQNDMFGGQSHPDFDNDMALFIEPTRQEIRKELRELEIDENKIEELVEKRLIKRVHQAMQGIVYNLNTMHSRAGAQVPFSSVNFGTDTSPEGRMVIKNFLLATDAGLGRHETPIFPISIFKVRKGTNYEVTDPNYDLFKLAIKVSAKRLFHNFSFMDSSFNKPYYKGDYNTEVAYMGCRTRVMANVGDEDKAVTPGRGNLSFTSINLPRLGIKHGIVRNDKTDMKGFYEELGELMDLVKDQLLERFEIQCNKRLYNFPFLLGQGVWIDSDKLKPNDRLRKILKHGTLSIGFIGLAECLKALIGKHHGESDEAQKLGLEIVEFMRKRCDDYCNEYKLNFTLLATPAEGLSGRFVNIDKAVYGKIKGVTDREYYTNSFHVPVYYNISIVNKIKKEGPYHKYTNAGHISYIELDGDTTNNLEAFEKIVRTMYENDMGYAAINHPVDRDPVCGYVGVIGDVCPGCGRKACEGVPIERVNEYKNSCNC